jgi:hypothetical protein
MKSKVYLNLFFVIIFFLLFFQRRSLSFAQTSESAFDPSVVSVPTIESSPILIESNCDQMNWCHEKEVRLHWTVASFISDRLDRFEWAIDTQVPNTKPLESIGTGSELFLNDLTDGVYYFTLVAKEKSGMAFSEQRYRLPIDTTPPEPFTPVIERSVIQRGDTTKIRFNTTDRTSGVDFYEVQFDGMGWQRKESPLVVEGSDLGVYAIEIRVKDKAGNIQNTKTSVEVLQTLVTNEFLEKLESGRMEESASGKTPFIILFTGLFFLALLLLWKYRRLKLKEMGAKVS